MAIKKSVSMPRRMFEFAIGRQQQLQYSTFSDYIQSLVRKDIESCERSVVISNLPTERQKLAAARRKAPAGHK